jgi:flagellar biosynthesis/type III secretory pathway protein FliH
VAPEQIIIDTGPRSVSWREIIATLRVLSAEQYEAWTTADKILMDTRREIAEMKAAAQREADEIRANAKRDAEIVKANAIREAQQIQIDAEDNGYRAGQQAALIEGRKVNDTWERIAAAFDADLRNVANQEQSQIVTFASLLAERIVRNALTDPAAFRKHLETLLQEDSGKPCLLLHANPDQVENLKRAAGRFPSLAEAIIEPDRTLEVGDLRLQYAWHKVDGRVHTMVGNGATVLLQDILLENEAEEKAR